MLPYQRLSEYFADQLNLPISSGTLHRHNREAHECAEALATYEDAYQNLLKQAEVECPSPKPPPGKRKRGRLKRTRARNLLERLITYQDDVLRFRVDPLVPFTNNLGEQDIRMTKVHQKIAGCFRSQLGAQMFCRIRGYLSTCRKQLVSASEALNSLFDGKLPQLDWQTTEPSTT